MLNSDELIRKYIEILQRWQKRINITSKHNTEKIFHSYINEAIALTKFFKSNFDAKIVDVGSGAGFPGIIFPMLGYENCCLIEKNSKKVVFLNHVAAELDLNVKIIGSKIEDIDIKNVDYITSKAFADADTVTKLCEKIIQKNTKIILPKTSEQIKVEGDLLDQKFKYVRHIKKLDGNNYDFMFIEMVDQ